MSERESRVEKIKRWGDIFSIGLVAIAYVTASAALAAAAALDIAISETFGKEFVKKWKKWRQKNE